MRIAVFKISVCFRSFFSGSRSQEKERGFQATPFLRCRDRPASELPLTCPNVKNLKKLKRKAIFLNGEKENMVKNTKKKKEKKKRGVQGVPPPQMQNEKIRIYPKN